MSGDAVSWRETKAKRRAAQPEVTDEEWAARDEAARYATEAYVLGYHLRELRVARGLTQAEVAKRLEVSQARVSQIERGRIHNMEAIRAYAAALGARVSLVIEWEDGVIKVA
ncbi:helix-turn-helix transcriptional regulator [Actinomadura sp. 3N508]|uniref:helix-turn-helix transcriptional regulator n=1 Tax=Actinomadura sp. 3N508 TaxID=3375153 RepID=UPI0037BA7D9A